MHFALVAFLCFTPVDAIVHNCNSQVINRYSTMTECKTKAFNLDLKARIVSASCLAIKGEDLA